MRLGEFLGKSVDIVEVAVGFVLVLLIKLGIVEIFVAELCQLRCGGFGARNSNVMLFLLDRLLAMKQGGSCKAVSDVFQP